MQHVPIVKLIDVSKRYVSGDDTVHAIRNCNLEILQGQFVYVIGPSGSGKSTLLNLIGGLSAVSDGRIIVFDKEYQKMSESDRALLRREHIGIIFQFYNLHEGMTVRENVELPMLIAGIPKSQRMKKSTSLLQLVDLEDREHHLPYELSGGEKQRVGIARALANGAKVLLADEPTGDLDHDLARKIMDLLVNLNINNRSTIVMVSHDLSLLREGFRLIRIMDGQINDDRIVLDPEELQNEFLASLESRIRKHISSGTSSPT